MLTRRQLLAAAGGNAQTGVAATAARSSGGGDEAVLGDTLEVERLLVWGYEHVLAAGTLEPLGREVITEQLAHEREHLATVAAVLGRGALAPLSLAAAQAALGRRHVAASPEQLVTQHRSVRLLVDLESVAEGAWFHALAKLQDPALAVLGARIMACEAQHWTVLSGLSHPGEAVITVPSPFVRGT